MSTVVTSIDSYKDTEDMLHLLKNLDSVPADELELIKRSFHDCLNATKDIENLKALVDYYLKINSQRALDILVGVREPHDRYLFDILVEYMKQWPQSAHRQQSLILISHIVHKSPAWLPKIINNSKVLQTFFSILKTDQEVVSLVTSLLILVELISTLPSIMAPCLSDIFECFSRLCISLAKQSSLNPKMEDFDSLHLHACLYRLFHRLYALYPCNFLAYLRSTYGSNRDSNKDNILAFHEILKPMLKRVRLHPLLVTAAKETECSNTRWINMEPHDIIAECAKLALDPIDGIQEECDFCSDIHLCCSASLSSHSNYAKSKTAINDEFCSPLSFAKTNPNSIIVQINNELLVGTEIASISSLIKDIESDSPELHINCSPMLSIASNESKNTALSPKVKIEMLLDVAQEAIPFSGHEIDTSVDRNIAAMSASPDVTLQRSVVGNESNANAFASNTSTDYLYTVVDEEEDNEVSQINANAINLSSISNCESSRIEGPMTPFISTTCYLTDDKHQYRYVCTDNELRTDETNDLVGNIKSSFRHANSRLRYQSQCVPSPDFLGEPFLKCSTLTKSKSCPVLYFNRQSDEQKGVKVSKESSKANQNTISGIIDSRNRCHDSFNRFHEKTCNEKPEYSRFSSITSSVTCNCNCLGYVNRDGTHSHKVCNCTCTTSITLCQYLKDQSRNNSHRSVAKSSSSTDRQQNSLSPLEILNRHLTLGSEICLKEVNNPLTSKKDVDWSHFGGEPPNDEINVLKNQIALMHAQLLFERQQRESHATRNRRLLKKAKECIALQEKFSAQRDQLLLQENEMELLKKELNTCRENLMKVETENRAKHKSLEEKIQNSIKKSNELEDNKRELKENIDLYKEQTRVLHINYQKLEAKNLELEEDLKRYNKQNVSFENIKKDNRNLKTQVLMLSELYQGLKDRFTTINKNATYDEIFTIENEVRNKELKELRIKLETTALQMESSKAKCLEIESQMAKKDYIISEQKQTIESNKSAHKQQLQAQNQRVEALKKVIQQLEIRILSLYGQLGMKEHEERLRQLYINEEQVFEGSSLANSSDRLTDENTNSYPMNHNYSNGNHN